VIPVWFIQLSVVVDRNEQARQPAAVDGDGGDVDLYLCVDSKLAVHDSPGVVL